MNVSRILSSALALSGALLLTMAAPIACSGAHVEIAEPAPSASATATATTEAATTTSVMAEEPPRPGGHKYAVSAESPTAVNLAMEVLAKGGSAVDGAITALLGVGLAQPVSAGIGGGGFALVYDAKTKKVTVLDFRETAPQGLKPNDYWRSPPEEKKRGVLVGVPGEVAGLFEMHARWGKLAFAEDVRPVADAAEKGSPVSMHLARALKWNEAWVKKAPRYSFFTIGGALRKSGDTFVNTALAATLRRIAAEGRASFYEGAIAKEILETARKAGSRMTESDLKSYKALEREPLHAKWEGHDIYTMPPPSAGGLMMLETLAMCSKAELLELGYGTGAYYHLLAEIFKGAIADRMRAIGDPAFINADIAELTSPPRMKSRRARIKMNTALVAEKYPLKESGTSHLVVVDAEGNVVSITSTVNNMFGAKLVTPGGFVLNDELSDFTTRSVGKLYGVNKGPNAPRGGARPASSMTPTIVLKDEKPVAALGGSGGTRIATGTSQALLSMLAFGRTPAQAVSDPRIDTPPTGGLLADSSIPAEVIRDLAKRGHVVNATKPNFSAIQAVSISEKDGVRLIEAASDPRKGGESRVAQ